MRLQKLSVLLLTAMALEAWALTGCVHPDSPAGRAAEDTKKAIRRAGDKTTETATKAGDQFERAAKEAGDAVSDAVDDIRGATNTNVKKEKEED
jgi:hypothetical protein